MDLSNENPGHTCLLVLMCIFVFPIHVLGRKRCLNYSVCCCRTKMTAAGTGTRPGLSRESPRGFVVSLFSRA